MIKRRLKNKLKSLIQQFPAVLLLGPRQVGKTTLARMIASEMPSVYLDLEVDTDRAKLDNPESYLRSNADRLVILDEVQRVPNIFRPLRSLIDQGIFEGRKAGRFLLLGSASLDLLQQSDESLAGRIAHLELSPVDILEVDPDRAPALWLRGGFPGSFLAESDDASMLWRRNFVRTYLERDMPQLGMRIPAETLRRFLTMTAHHQSGLLNAASLARGLSVDGKTIAHYVDLLTDLFLLRRLPPWHGNVGKRLTRSPKIYLRDSGVLHALLGIPDRETLAGHPIFGASWEGFVVEELCAALPDGSEPYFYRTAGGDEIDLVLDLPRSERWAIEIKAGEVPRLSENFMRSSEAIQATKRFIVYADKERYSLNQNTEGLGVRELAHEIATHA